MLNKPLVVVQVAMAVVLLIGASLLVESAAIGSAKTWVSTPGSS